jgi:hypothetical protein
MPRSRTLMTVQILFAICSGLTCLSLNAFSQSAPSVQSSNPFEDFFNRLAAAQGVGGRRGEATYIKLTDSIGAMTPAEIAAGIPVIDRQIDSTAEPEDRLAKVDAANLLMFISWRQDGAELLASQIDRLASMLNDPSHLLSGPAVMTLQSISRRRPDAVVPILEAALKLPEVNNSTGVGPGIAGILLQAAPPDEESTKDIVEYMRRPDLTESQLVATIMGINNSPVIPDSITAELVRCLDRPNDRIKIRALMGIAGSSQSAKDTARVRIQKMAKDPGETAHVRRIATEALEGKITENPESNK